MEILLILAILMIFYVIQERVYINNCYKNLDVRFSFRDKAVFQGEKTEIIQTIENRKIMPLWWIKLQYEISSNIIFEDSKEEKSLETISRIEEFSVVGYEKIERKTVFSSTKRGCYKLNNIQVSTSDLFVVTRAIMELNSNEELYVFPKQIPADTLIDKFDKLLGDVITKKQLIEDPFELRGIREYSSYDSMKDINWNATAKTNSMKVNQYNFTNSEDVVIFLSLGRENSWVEDDTIEEVISLASSINTQLSEVGATVKIITDYIENETNIEVESGNGREHDLLVNMELSKIDITETKCNLSTYIRDEILKGNTDPIWIVISNYTGQDMKDAILEARYNNFQVNWIVVEDKNVKLSEDRYDEIVLWEVS